MTKYEITCTPTGAKTTVDGDSGVAAYIRSNPSQTISVRSISDSLSIETLVIQLGKLVADIKAGYNSGKHYAVIVMNPGPSASSWMPTYYSDFGTATSVADGYNTSSGAYAGYTSYGRFGVIYFP